MTSARVAQTQPVTLTLPSAPLHGVTPSVGQTAATWFQVRATVGVTSRHCRPCESV